MLPRFLMHAALVVLIGVLCQRSFAADKPTSRPNIVLILIDDMGWGDFSCFGNTKVETTNIDPLAIEGMRFEQFYVNAPICSPSRTAISTGQYPTRWQITSYLSNRLENERRGIAQWLDPKAPTLARILRDAGYTTGHFGKWHMGGQRDVGDAPLIGQYGFDVSLTSFEGLGPRVLPLLGAYDGKEPQKYALGSDTLGHGELRWEKRDKVTKSYTDAAIDFIDRARKSNQPFYVNLWPDDVHSPFFPPRDRRGNESKRDRYLGVLKTLDDQLKPLFDRIQNDRALRNNTLMCYSAAVTFRVTAPSFSAVLPIARNIASKATCQTSSFATAIGTYCANTMARNPNSTTSQPIEVTIRVSQSNIPRSSSD